MGRARHCFLRWCHARESVARRKHHGSFGIIFLIFRGEAMYGLLYRVVLRRLPAEGAHRAGFWIIRAAAEVPGGTWALRRWLGPQEPVLRVRALGLEFPGPV